MTVEFKRTVAIAELPWRYGALSLALTQSGIPAEGIEPLLRDCVLLRCIQCGASTPGAGFVALGQSKTDAMEGCTELERLSQNHCVTETCPCCFCELRLAPADNVDWECAIRAEPANRSQRLWPGGESNVTAGWLGSLTFIVSREGRRARQNRGCGRFA